MERLKQTYWWRQTINSVLSSGTVKSHDDQSIFDGGNKVHHNIFYIYVNHAWKTFILFAKYVCQIWCQLIWPKFHRWFRCLRPDSCKVHYSTETHLNWWFYFCTLVQPVKIGEQGFITALSWTLTIVRKMIKLRGEIIKWSVHSFQSN